MRQDVEEQGLPGQEPAPIARPGLIRAVALDVDGTITSTGGAPATS